jgi:hypothetical protein
MHCIDCCVIRAGDRWYAHLEQRPVGPFGDMDMALKVAIAEAMTLRRSQREARVSVREKDGTLRAARCLCDRFAASQQAWNETSSAA